MADVPQYTTVARPKDYWMSPRALSITRNALGEANRIAASVTGGSQFFCHFEDIGDVQAETLFGYDVAHNFRSWPLNISQTFFNTNDAILPHIAIPRRDKSDAKAMVVFPTERLDLWGYATDAVPMQDEDGNYIDDKGDTVDRPEDAATAYVRKKKAEGSEQDADPIGSEDYYYIYLHGRLTSSGSGGTIPREWDPEIDTGRLNTDETWGEVITIEQLAKEMKKKVDVEWFQRVFTIHGTGRKRKILDYDEDGEPIYDYDEDGNIIYEGEDDERRDIRPNDMDHEITDTESMFGTWARQWVSALGMGSGGGGGEGGDALEWPLLDINTQGMPTPGTLGGPQTGDAIVYDKTLNGGTGGFKWGKTGGGLSGLHLYDGTEEILPTVSGDSYTYRLSENFLSLKNGGIVTGQVTVSGANLIVAGGTLTVGGDILLNHAQGFDPETAADNAVLTKKETETLFNGKYVTIDFFESLFELHSGASGNPKIKTNADLSEYTAQQKALFNIKSMFGTWTQQYLSALGIGSDGSSGGVAYLSLLEDVNVGTLSPTDNGKALIYDSSLGKWVKGTAGIDTTELNRILQGKTLTITDGSRQLGNQWNAKDGGSIDISGILTGKSWWGATMNIASGVVTGTITVGDGDIILNNNKKIKWKKSSGTDSFSMLTLDNSNGTNHFIVGEASTANNGIDTYIRGNGIVFQTVSGQIDASLFIPQNESVPVFYVRKLKIGSIVISEDTRNGGLHVENAGIYADTYVSTLGTGSSGSGGTPLNQPLMDINAIDRNPTAQQIGYTLVWGANGWDYGKAGMDETQLTTFLGTYTGFDSRYLTDTNLKSQYSWWGARLDANNAVTGDMTNVGSISASGNNTITRTTGGATYFRAENSNGAVELITQNNRGLYDRTKKSWIIGTNGTNTFLSQGNIGIGTTSPAVKLDVRGDIMVTQKLYLYKPNADDDTNAVYLEYVSGQSGVHLSGAGLYADTFVSALGTGSSGGAGGLDLELMWNSLTNATTDSYANTKINNKHLNLGTLTINNEPWNPATSGNKSITTISTIAQATDKATYFTDTVANSAAKWATARNFTITDASQTNSGTAVSVDGSNADGYTLLLPSKIKATLNGNADTATKLKSKAWLWGNQFDGSQNIGYYDSENGQAVNANLSYVNNISMVGTITGCTSIDATLYFIKSNNTISQVNVGSSTAATFTNGTSSTGAANEVTPKLYVNDHFGVNGNVFAKAVELYNSSPYIDFHNGSSTADYTTRIIENASGVLTVRASGSGATGLVVSNSSAGRNGDYIRIGGATIYWDSTNQGLHIDKGLYSDSYVSSLGTGSSGGSGGGVDLSDVWASLRTNTDSYKNYKIHNSHLNFNANFGTMAYQDSSDYVLAEDIGTLTIKVGTTTAGTWKPTDGNGTITIDTGSGTGDGLTWNDLLTANNHSIGSTSSRLSNLYGQIANLSNKLEIGSATTGDYNLFVDGKAKITTGLGINTFMSNYQFSVSGKSYFDGLTELDNTGTGNTLEVTGNSVFDGDITATKFIVDETSTGFLKADGTVDTSTYAKTTRFGDITIEIGAESQTFNPLDGTQTIQFEGGGGEISAATSAALGGIKIGYTESGKYYAVKLDNNNKAYVNVPWEDNNTKNTAGALSNNGTKLFLVGASSQTANPVTNTIAGCYIGTDGFLYSNSSKTVTETSIGSLGTNIGVAKASSAIFVSDASGGKKVGLYADSNRGVYDWTASKWLVGTNGTNTWLSIGNVGIGTTDPESYKLKVNGTGYFTGDLYSNGKKVLTEGSGGGGGLSWTDLAGGSGHSIGNTSPLDELGCSYACVYKNTSTGSWATDSGAIVVKNALSDTSPYMLGLAVCSGGEYGEIQVSRKGYGEKNLVLQKKGGSVGIGTTDPGSYKLKVNGTGYFTGDLYSNGSKVLTSGNTVTTDTTQTISGEKTFSASSTIVKGSLIVGGDNSLGLDAVLSTDNNDNLSITTGSDIYLKRNTAAQTKLTVGQASVNTSYNFYVNGTSLFNGNVGIGGYSSNHKLYVSGDMRLGGNNSSSYKFDMNKNKIVLGNIWLRGDGDTVYFDASDADEGYVRGTGGCTIVSGSDIRLKNVVEMAECGVEDVARAPIFKFTWKDSKKEVLHLGTSAQYWKELFPCAVPLLDDGYYSMDYGATALAAAVMTARTVLSHEERIKKLEAENERLRNEIELLKAA